MNQKPNQKLASAFAARSAAEKALLLAEASAKRAHTARVEFKLAKKTWKLARKAAKRTAKEARCAQRKLAKVNRLLKNVKPKARKPAAAKSARSKTRRANKKPVTPISALESMTPEILLPQTTPADTGN